MVHPRTKVRHSLRAVLGFVLACWGRLPGNEDNIAAPRSSLNDLPPISLRRAGKPGFAGKGL